MNTIFICICINNNICILYYQTRSVLLLNIQHHSSFYCFYKFTYKKYREYNNRDSKLYVYLYNK